MDKELHGKISQWLMDHREDMIADIQRLVSIRSVATYDEPPTPFGTGCKKALEEMLQIGREHGFQTKNFEDYCGCLYLSDADPAYGFWGHLDVVPEGDLATWDFSPYAPVYKDGYLIGRGVDDNKGPTVGVMYVIQCLKELGVPLRHNLKLFVGCDEEHGMRDAVYYAEHYDCPELTLVADCGFPVSYGEKGIIETDLVSLKPFSGNVLELHGGVASNVIPAEAYIRLALTPEITAKLLTLPEDIAVERAADSVTLTAHGKAGHSANPKGSVNAIHLLTKAVLEAHLLPAQDEEALAFFAQVSGEHDGTTMGIRMEDEISGPLTCAGTRLDLREGHAVLHLNIRYCITADSDQMLANMEAACAAHGCRLQLIRNSKPNYFPREHPVVDVLTAVYNDLTGNASEPYTMGGGTYARKLPRAFAYGVGGLERPPRDFLPEGHGGGHGPDEAIYIDGLIEGLSILAMGIIEIDPIPAQ